MAGIKLAKKLLMQRLKSITNSLLVSKRLILIASKFIDKPKVKNPWKTFTIY